jgi:hypothetical protein
MAGVAIAMVVTAAMVVEQRLVEHVLEDRPSRSSRHARRVTVAIADHHIAMVTMIIASPTTIAATVTSVTRTSPITYAPYTPPIFIPFSLPNLVRRKRGKSCHACHER